MSDWGQHHCGERVYEDGGWELGARGKYRQKDDREMDKERGTACELCECVQTWGSLLTSALPSSEAAFSDYVVIEWMNEYLINNYQEAGAHKGCLVTQKNSK